MKAIKAIFKNKLSRIWFIVTSIVLALIIVVNIVGGVVFYDLLCIVLGRGKPVLAETDEDAVFYESDYFNKNDALEKSNALNIEFNKEGIVMLKNDNALPLASGNKISVFGKNSVNLVYGGSGSGGVSADESTKTIYDSLEAAGFDYNPTLKKFYENNSQSGSGRDANPSMNSGGVPGFKTGETPVANYSSVQSSYNGYNDAALIVFSRIGGEGADLPRTMATSVGGSTPVDGARSATDHYLQLDKNETDLIKHVCEQNFKHVIIVLNSNSAMELGFLDDPTHYAYNSKIDGCLWIGSPGKSGIMALGTVLNGETNPSGRTVDTYARDWTKSPTWNNFGNNRVTDGDRYTVDGKSKAYYFVDYEEGIYVGYRYYETRGFTDGEEWYKQNVVYPFGYGLSYTTFTTEIVEKSAVDGSAITKDGKIKVTVKVTNTGDTAGKEVVQLYATPHYYDGGIEKAHKVLVGFEKTPMLYPQSEAGADKPNSCELEIEVDPYQLASYDYKAVSGKAGYVLEHGTYVFSVSKNAHEVIDTFTCTVAEDIRFDDGVTAGSKVENLFDDADDQLGSVLSRTDWEGTWPKTRTEEERAVTDDFIKSLSVYDSGRPETATTAATAAETTETDDEDITLRDLIGADYDDPRWEKLLDKISFGDMVDLFNKGAFQTIALLDIGKPRTNDSDGPVGWTNFMDPDTYSKTCSYASECVLGSTWNKEILYQMGESVGNEALVGANGVPYTGWYAPAVNIHRSAFGGRNFEYFSEDGYFSGIMATYEIKGAMSKGVLTQLKHFALNEQETHRSTNGVLTWATEQSIREIYFKPFEIAVKEGGTRGIMSSFNRIGDKWAGGDYRLLTTVLRKEWGFNGVVISDYNDATPYMNPKQMAYAGGNLNLASRQDFYWTNAKESNAQDVAVLRENTHGLLYAIANSNALNVEVLRYTMPTWEIIMIVVDVVLIVGLGVWGYFAVKKALKKDEQTEQVEQTD